MSDNTENVEIQEEPAQNKKMRVVASATFTKEMVQNAVLKDLFTNDEYREQLEGQELAAFFQFNPHHTDSFCLLTLARDMPADDQKAAVTDDSKSLPDESPLSLTDEE